MPTFTIATATPPVTSGESMILRIVNRTVYVFINVRLGLSPTVPVFG